MKARQPLRQRARELRGLTSFLRSETMPAVRRTHRVMLYFCVCLTTAALTGLVWGDISPAPAIHDELAYELQCRIFATGSWTVPTPPLPDFFQQMYVFDRPAVASKYWPVHSMLIAPGCALGVPGLVPLLLSGLSGALVVALALRFAGRAWAVTAWLLWLCCPVGLQFRATYLSQATTTVLFLVALLIVDDWTRRPSRAKALGLGALMALSIGARPLTGVALFAPVVWLVARRSWEKRQFTEIVALGVAAVAGLSIIPLWSYNTIGRVSTTPYAEYSRQFFPFDKPGFSFDSTPLSQALPRDMQEHGWGLGAFFRDHTVASLPTTTSERLVAMGQALFGGWRVVTVPFWLIGAWVARRHCVLRTALVSCGSTFVAHLGFAHPPSWTAYYLETFPVVYVLVGVGLAHASTVADSLRWHVHRERALGVASASLLLFFAATDVAQARNRRSGWQAQVQPAWAAFSALHGPAIVFVTYSPGWELAFGLVRHEVNLPGAKVWVVRDLGPRNTEMLALAPNRSAFLYETGKGILSMCEPKADCARPSQ